MRLSAQQQLTDHLTAMLEKSPFWHDTEQTVQDCPECGGEGFTDNGTKLALCETCKGQRMIVQTVNKNV